MQMLGSVISSDEAVGIGVNGFGFGVVAPLEDDVDRSARARRVEAHCDGLANQRRIDFVEDPL
jgi:hypothetical protein